MFPTSSSLKELDFGLLFRRTKSHNAINEVDDSGDNVGNNAETLTSDPVKTTRKRSLFNGKWLPTAVRKLSPGKLNPSTWEQLVRAVAAVKMTSSFDRKPKLPPTMPIATTTTDTSVTDHCRSVPSEDEQNVYPINGDATLTGDGANTDHNDGIYGPEEVNNLDPLTTLCDQSLVATASAIHDEVQVKRGQHSHRDKTRQISLETLNYLALECLKEYNKSGNLESPPLSSVATFSHAKNDQSDSVKTGNGNFLPVNSASSANNGTDDDVSFKKRMLVIEELVKTEQDYVRDLKDIIEGYMTIMKDPNSCIPMPEELKGGRDKIIFGNIEAIYEWHRDIFSKALEKCLDHPEELGPLFKKYARKLRMYVVYCQNKPLSEFVVTEYMDNYFEEIRLQLGHKLTLCDLLIKPVQRIMKYQLLLKDILKYTKRLEKQDEIRWMNDACTVMHVVPKEANDMMAVGRLQGFDRKITQLGKLVLIGSLICSEGTSALNFKGKELQFFFFEQSIIISEAVGKKTQCSNPVYIYKARFLVNKMKLVEQVDDGDPLKFIITSTDPKEPALSYVCQASDQANRDEWVQNLQKARKSLESILDAIQNPQKFRDQPSKEW